MRSPAVRAAGYAAAILHVWISLARVSPWTFLRLELSHDEWALWPAAWESAAGWTLAACGAAASALLCWRCRSLAAARRALEGLWRIEPRDPEIEARLARISFRLGVEPPRTLLLPDPWPTPFVLGWRSPLLAFPRPLLARLAGPELDAVLAHEIAHLKGRDGLINLLLAAAETILFFNPFHGFLAARLRGEIEALRDAVASRAAGGDARIAAGIRRILEGERMALRAPGCMAGAGFALLGDRILRRRLALLDSPPRRGSAWPRALGLLALALAMPFAPGLDANAIRVRRLEAREEARWSPTHSTVSVGLVYSPNPLGCMLLERISRR